MGCSKTPYPISGTQTIVRFLLSQTPTLLLSVSCSRLFLDRENDWLRSSELRSTIERLLFLKLYLQQGIIKSTYDQFLAESRMQYPAVFARLRRFRRGTTSLEQSVLRFESFGLLRRLAEEVHNSLSLDQVPEEPAVKP